MATPSTRSTGAAASDKARGRVTLADLTDEDRRKLREEARESTAHNPVDVDGYAELTENEKRARAIMDARDHSRGCPVSTGAMLGRIEAFETTKPPNPEAGIPARPVTTARCVECGGITIIDRPLDEALADAELPDA